MVVNVTTPTNNPSNIFRHTNCSESPAAAAETVFLQEPLLLGLILGQTGVVE